MTGFIDVERIESLLAEGRRADRQTVEDVIERAAEKEGLTPAETAVLLGCEDTELWEEIYALARKIKEDIYGRRIVLFAPLYVSNLCQNDCLYCAFRRSNEECARIALGPEEVAREVRALESVGHKRLLMVYGEHPAYGVDYMMQTIRAAYETRSTDRHGEIRRINVNAAPLSVEDFRRLKEAEIGTFQVFQETYHPGRYREVHPPNTRKGDFEWRLYALHRAQEAGIDDVAVGALFGLYDWRFEVMGLLMHALDMERVFGVGPHTISFPRLEPAINTPFTGYSRWKTSDEEFKRLVAVLRLMVPYTGLILTARERPELRREYIRLGVSQIDGGTRIDIGGYGKGPATVETEKEKQQFEIFDNRSLDEVVLELAKTGYVPSFCTACYRSARTGETFMEFAKHGDIKNMCLPNAILTFKEYLEDFASPATRLVGAKLIEELLRGSENGPRSALEKKIARIERGERDVYC